MTDETIHIAFCFDDNFVMPAGVLLVSMFETNKMNKFFIHVFSSGLCDYSIRSLEAITKKYKAGFRFYRLTCNDFANFNTTERITLATYYRLVIPHMVDSSLKKILYLDADIIINGNIKPLWDTDLDGMVIGAVEDIVAIDTKEYERLKTPEKYGYFNSGILLINIEKWKELGITKKLFNILNNNYMRFHDQDGLNLVLFDKRKKLSPVWNQQVGTYYCYPQVVNKVFQGIEAKYVQDKSVVIHFNGREKPWHYVSSHPYTKIFRKYLKLSGFNSFPEKITMRKILKKQAYKVLGWKYLSRLIYQKQKKLQDGEKIT